MNDNELLRDYVRNRSEVAFTEFVRRHLDIVYSAALRRVQGDAHRAEDIAQAVFADLARKAASLVDHPALIAWLYTSTYFTAAKLMRTERRQQSRDHEVHLMNELLADSSAPLDWNALRPVLDDALHDLNERERTALVLRFFEQCSMAELGARLGLTERGARKRMDRALENLRTRLSRRGITSTSAALTTVLASQTVSAAPAGLINAVTHSALSPTVTAAAATGSAATLLALFTTTMTAIKLTPLAGLVAVVCASSVIYLVFGRFRDIRPLPADHEISLSIREEPRASLRSGTAPENPRIAAFAKLAAERHPLGYFGFNDPFNSKARPIGDPVIIAYLKDWGKAEPLVALDYVRTKLDAPNEVMARYENVILQGWALVEPEPAWRWAVDSLSSHPAIPAYNQFAFDRYEAITGELIQAGQFEIVAQLMTNAREPFSYRSSPALVAAWARTDLTATVHWLESLPPLTKPGDSISPNPFLKDLGLEALGKTLAKGDSMVLRSIFENMTLEAGETSGIGLGVLGAFFDQGNVAGARAWVQEFLDPAQLAKLPAGDAPKYEWLIGRFFNSAARLYPNSQVDSETELSMLASIVDEKRRVDAATNFVRRARNSNVEAARLAIERYYPANIQSAELQKLPR